MSNAIHYGGSKSATWEIPGILDELRSLYDQEISHRAIAASLARAYHVNVTRNAVIGKCKRMGFPVRTCDEPRLAAARARSENTERRKKANTPHTFLSRNAPRSRAGLIVYKAQLVLFDPVTDEDAYSAPETRKSLLDLERNDCRFVYGDRDFKFCAKPVVEGCSYCGPHFARVFEPRKDVNKFMCAAE